LADPASHMLEGDTLGMTALIDFSILHPMIH